MNFAGIQCRGFLRFLPNSRKNLNEKISIIKVGQESGVRVNFMEWPKGLCTGVSMMAESFARSKNYKIHDKNFCEFEQRKFFASISFHKSAFLKLYKKAKMHEKRASFC